MPNNVRVKYRVWAEETAIGAVVFTAMIASLAIPTIFILASSASICVGLGS